MSFLSYSKTFQGLADVFMHDPARYLPLAQFIATVMNGESELSKAERETIALFVSSLNDCHYCVGAHGAVLAGLGADKKAIDAAAASATQDAGSRMAPMLEFARKLTLTPGDVGQADVDAVTAAGWSDQAVEDAIGVIGLFSLANRLVDGLGITGSPDSIAKSGGMVAEHGYAPLVQILQQKTEAA